MIGVSDQNPPAKQGAPSVFSANEGQIVFAGAEDPSVGGVPNPDPTIGEIRLRDGAGSIGSDNYPIGSYVQNTWYNIWMVLDNQPGATNADKVTVYGSTGSGAPVLLLTDPPTGANPATFRNKTTDALVTFQILAGFQGPVPGYVDDIYVDTTGTNLTNPTLPPAGLGAGFVPEPSSLVLLLMSLALLVGRGRPTTKR